MESRSIHGGLVIALAVAFIVLAAAAPWPAQATVSDQQGESALAGINNWYTLAPGQSAEWVFHYPGRNQPALIAFGVDPANTIAVNVYDDAQWQALGAGDRSVVPVGKGTSGTIGKWDANKDLMDNGRLFWEANAKPGVTFHVQVTNPSQQPARYWIAHTGAGAGELTAVSAGSPAAQAGATPLAAATAGAPGQLSATAATSSPASGAQPAQPPHTLPVSGAPVPPALFAAGSALAAAGWLIRRRTN